MKKLFLFFLISQCIFAQPPQQIPPDLYNEYTQFGQIPVYPYYINETSQNVGIKKYKRHEIEKYRIKAERQGTAYYGITDVWLHELLRKHPKLLKGKEVAIIGSTVPWYEAVVLAYGGKPTTVEYNFIEIEDTRVSYMSAQEMKNHPKKFDVVLSISSFEHDGLGRYGDPLNPSGDLEAMDFWRGCLKDDGYMILSVPVGQDSIFWNAHRIYGRIRFPKLIKGFSVLDAVPSYQTIDTYLDLPPDSGRQPILLLNKTE